MREWETPESEAARLAQRAPSGEQSEAASPSLLAQRLASPEAVLDLQRSGGNEATVQLLSAQRDSVQRDEDGAEAEGGQAGAGRSPVLDIVGRGGGQPLDEGVRSGMEQAIGADLGDVRVHTDGAAAESAKAVQAHAYTVGNDVVFGSGNYQPETPDGQRMLAHELTHVVQQRSGPVDGTSTGDGVAVSDPSDRFEQAAEANADRVMAAGGVQRFADEAVAQRQTEGGTGLAGSGLADAGVVQREAMPAEDEAPAEDEEQPEQAAPPEAIEAPEEDMA